MSTNTELSPFKISFDEPQRLFRPGDVVKGKIKVNNFRSNDLERIHVILEGRAKTKITLQTANGKHIYRARAPLVYQISSVERIENQWTFSITIPTSTQKLNHVAELLRTRSRDLGLRYWDHDWKDKQGYESNPGHVLPPSMRFGPKGVSKISKGYVKYNLTAVGSQIDEKRKLIPTKYDHQLLWITVPSFQSQPSSTSNSSQDLEFRTFRLDPDFGTRPLSFKEKLKTAFSLDRVPRYKCYANIHTPEITCMGSAIPISISFTVPSHLAQWNFLPAGEPEIAVQSIHATLRSTTASRTVGPVGSAYDKVSADGPYIPIKTPRNGEGLFSPPAPNTKDGARPRITYNTAALPRRMTPTFQTYNIRHSYTLKVRAMISCAGEIRQVDVKQPIVVLPKPRPTMALGAKVGEDDTAEPLGEDELDKDEILSSQEMAAMALEGINLGLDIVNAVSGFF